MSTQIILLGHGSRRMEANQGLLKVAEKVADILGQTVTPAFMGHAEPSLPEAVKQKILEGANKIIIMPLFLFKGMHVTVDIHEDIKEISENNPGVQIIFTEELGPDDTIAYLAGKRIKEAM